jgi:hypothetical protein
VYAFLFFKHSSEDCSASSKHYYCDFLFLANGEDHAQLHGLTEGCLYVCVKVEFRPQDLLVFRLNSRLPNRNSRVTTHKKYRRKKSNGE